MSVNKQHLFSVPVFEIQAQTGLRYDVNRLYVIEQEPGVIYLHEMTTCLLGIF